MTSAEITEKLIVAKEAYYSSDSPIMSDAEFDALENKLRELDPANPYFTVVGTSASSSSKITHTVPMLSMQKAKSIEEVVKWITRLSLPDSNSFCIQPKIDGLSATCCYENGKLLYVATRGDGITGQDITHVASYIPDILESVKFTTRRIEVRGELYLPKDTEYDTGGRPLRNNCVGLINRKENRDNLHHVRFAAFQINGDELIATETAAIELLTANGFHTVSTEKAVDPEKIETYFNHYLNELRSKWKYETDGLVICVNDRSLFAEIDSRWVVDHHHHYAIALKPPAEAKETSLTRVEWQISRQGNAIPVAVFAPVFLGGARIERASLANYEAIKRMNICIGDTLLIERANDVIPYVRKNLSAGSPSRNTVTIKTCPSCETELVEKGVHLRCENTDCPETTIQKILFWVKESGMEQIAEATVRTLYSKGIVSSIQDLYSITEKDLIGVEGFATKKISSFLKEVSASRRMTARDFIAKLGIPLVQKKALAKLQIFFIEDFLSFEDTTYIIGNNIISWKQDAANMLLFNELREALDIEDEENVLNRKKVCMTGKGPLPRKELITRIENMGYEFSDTITAQTDILLCEDPQGSSSKLKKAEKNGTTLISYEDFFQD
ncbi:MAG: hypothetical protein PF637_12520 [Spirochaetes bacterium]|jgi:DNA ligase (NAD+)|nr:hypothetical protein [Spirochaetota bacterium]